MKISASIYSNKGQSVTETIRMLDQNSVDMLHVDCNDDISVFEDIRSAREITNIPVDLHIITPHPSKYYDLLEEHPAEYVTFQYEDLQEELIKPENSTGKWGLAITTNTPVSVFDQYADVFDFILIMATIPGQSGGVFDKLNFQKIRTFARNHPTKRIHVDGGVNAEVSFILRNMGVYSSVSGSFLFKQDSVGKALLLLQSKEIDSEYRIKDFMISYEHSPVISNQDLSFQDLLMCIEDYKFGFCMIADQNKKLLGISSNADIRKGLLKNMKDLNEIKLNEVLNTHPKTVNENLTVKELLQFVKKINFPILYLPVINDNKEIMGTITFLNLIKGEL